jgi:hypothetical protein
MAKRQRIDIDADGVWVSANALDTEFCRIEGGYASSSDSEMFSWSVEFEDLGVEANSLCRSERLITSEYKALTEGATIEIGSTRDNLGMPDVFGLPEADQAMLCTSHAKLLFEDLFGDDVAFYPWSAPLKTHKDVVLSGLWIMHVLPLLDCADPATATFTTRFDGKRYLDSYSFCIDPQKVPGRIRVFRVSHNESTMFCRTSLIPKLVKAKCRHISVWPVRVVG